MHLCVSSTASLLLLLVTGVTKGNAQSLPVGKRVYYVGNSFHMFLPDPIESLVKEAGIQNHRTVGRDMIGGSTPLNHWEKGGVNGTNAVKEALKNGTVDIMTLVSRDKHPEPGITNFAKLAFQYNPNIRVMLQENWITFSSNPDEGCTGDFRGCSNRDAATIEGLEATIVEFEEPYQAGMRDQLKSLNAEAGKDYASVVPIWEAILKLRIEVKKGNVPGVVKQTDLFVDALGHPKQPLKDLLAYMWFAAMYGVNPQGMKALLNTNGTSIPGQAEILQKIAWDTLQSEPLNGLKNIEYS